jgi:hypothetical protein
MKKFTLFLSALLISAMSFAADITITSAETVTQDGVTIVFDKASGSNAPAWYAAGLRLYAKNTVTISAETEITNITFNWEKQGSKQFAGLTANVGTYTHPESAGEAVWTGSAKEVVFTVGDKGQLQLNTLSVTVGAGQDDGNDPEPEEPETPTEPEQPEQPEGVLTCAEAVAICQETGETPTTETYTIRGYVTNIASAYNAGYNNTSFWMADTKDGGKVFEAFRSTPLAEADKAVKVGDYVEVTGNLVNYKGNTPETAQGGTYTFLEAAEGGEDPVEPEQPETPEEKPLTDGYTKVTNISALATGDKVVLYCDAYAVGVAGFDGNKSGIMAETGWVEYVVETVEGGILLKDEAAGKYAALLAKNSFHYADQGSVFNVTENALLATFLESENKTFFLYRNTNSQYGNPLCRMYTDKTGQAEYAPFYVYEVAGSNPTAVDNVTVNQNITKFFENGQLIIIKDGVKFNAQGQVVK